MFSNNTIQKIINTYASPIIKGESYNMENGLVTKSSLLSYVNNDDHDCDSINITQKDRPIDMYSETGGIYKKKAHKDEKRKHNRNMVCKKKPFICISEYKEYNPKLIRGLSNFFLFKVIRHNRKKFNKLCKNKVGDSNLIFPYIVSRNNRYGFIKWK